MPKKLVPGTNKGEVFIYALSTCGWCRKTKTLLDGLGVEYYYVDVDLENDADRSAVTDEMIHWNPKLSFPTIVINNETCIVGFNEDSLKQALGL
jgi:glutaredoxin-like protein NrdH